MSSNETSTCNASGTSLSRYEKMQFVSELNAGVNDQRRRFHETLGFFMDTPKAEAAFYLRFEQMSEADKTFLKAQYRHIVKDGREVTDWLLFSLICKYWSVNLRINPSRHRRA
jgi:hypothetical protein